MFDPNFSRELKQELSNMMQDMCDLITEYIRANNGNEGAIGVAVGSKEGTMLLYGDNANPETAAAFLLACGCSEKLNGMPEDVLMEWWVDELKQSVDEALRWGECLMGFSQHQETETIH